MPRTVRMSPRKNKSKILKVDKATEKVGLTVAESSFLVSRAATKTLVSITV